MALIPIVLEFSHVARNSSLSLTLEADGVAWSLGEGGEGGIGFSYNSLALEEVRTSCIHSIELTDSLLAIRTSPNGAADSSFTVALFLDVSPGVESLAGRCTLNSGASVLAHLGYDAPAPWISGSVSAILRPIPEDIRRVRFNIQQPSAGNPIRIELMTETGQPGIAHWCFGPEDNSAASFTVKMRNGTALPLRTLRVSDRMIEVFIDPEQVGESLDDIFIEAYVRRVPATHDCKVDLPLQKLAHIHLKSTCGGETIVVAQIGAQRAQYLTTAYKRFQF